MDSKKSQGWTPELDGKILGVNHRTYVGPGRSFANITVVLVAGSIGDYAAYIAGGRSPEWTRDNGDKLSFAEACVHFPGGQLERGRYRE